MTREQERTDQVQSVRTSQRKEGRGKRKKGKGSGRQGGDGKGGPRKCRVTEWKEEQLSLHGSRALA